MVSGFIKRVEGHLISGNYVVIGKVCHSQKMNDPCVPLWITANREGAISSAHCRGCMAGIGECCSHVASFRCWAARLARSANFSGSPRNLWWPRFFVGTQSTLKRSHSLAGFARNKMFTADKIIFAFPFSEIISAYRRNPSSSSLLLLEELKKSLSFPCLPVLFPYPMMRQRTIAVVIKIRKRPT